jgi:hypothetical protein
MVHGNEIIISDSLKVEDIVLSFRSVFLMKPFVRLRVEGFFCFERMGKRMGRIHRIFPCHSAGNYGITRKNPFSQFSL